MKNEILLKELSSEELLAIDGGWNLIEYIAMGIGHIHGKFAKAPVGGFEYAGYGHVGGARP